jgi:hypothetical protein
MSSASETGARAEKQLDRVLGFFPRVEAKASFLFALDVGLLGYGVVNLGREDLHSAYVVAFGAAFLALTVVSLLHIYWCVSPHLKGGANSLIYFREIAGRTELEFADTFLSRTDESHARDAAGQIWRNSAILEVRLSQTGLRLDHARNRTVGRIPRVGRPAAFPVVRSQVSDHGTVGRSRRRHQRRPVGILGRQGRGGRAVDRECGVVRGRREDRCYNALRRPCRLHDLSPSYS